MFNEKKVDFETIELSFTGNWRVCSDQAACYSYSFFSVFLVNFLFRLTSSIRLLALLFSIRSYWFSSILRVGINVATGFVKVTKIYCEFNSSLQSSKYYWKPDVGCFHIKNFNQIERYPQYHVSLTHVGFLSRLSSSFGNFYSIYGCEESSRLIS